MARERSVRRIGVLTGGGDAPGLNAVIRAVVKVAVGHYGWEVLGVRDGFEGLLTPERTTPLTLDSVRGLLPRGGTILGTTNRSNPFAHRAEVDGRVVVRDRSVEVLDRIADLGLDGLIVIGGDGTLSIARELFRLGAPVVGVPKTIDNDISATDRTFGFDTALATATDAIDKLHTTAESHHRVMLVEVMGRHAGWLALHAGLAGGADIILIPEIPFRLDPIVEQIDARDAAGRHFSIVVVAEGAFPAGGREFTLSDPRSGRARLGGVGHWLAAELAERTPHEVRVTVLGHVQRGGSPSPLDRILATRFGAAAVERVARREFGTMVALHGQEIAAVTLDEAVGQPNRVPPDGDLVRTARALGIGFGD